MYEYIENRIWDANTLEELDEAASYFYDHYYLLGEGKRDKLSDLIKRMRKLIVRDMNNKEERRAHL